MDIEENDPELFGLVVQKESTNRPVASGWLYRSAFNTRNTWAIQALIEACVSIPYSFVNDILYYIFWLTPNMRYNEHFVPLFFYKNLQKFIDSNNVII